MIFSPNAVITKVYAYEHDFNKTQIQQVKGRNFHSISLRLSGAAVFKAGDTCFESRENSITFMPQGTDYQTQILEGGKLLVIHFTTMQKYYDLSPLLIKTDDSEIRELFHNICNNFNSGNESNYKNLSLLYSILYKAERPYRHCVPRRIRYAKEYIDSHYAEQISISKLAQDCNLSEVHFRNEFKKYFQVSPVQYVKSVRINNAKHRLSSGYYTVAQVACDCGFDSISYFSYEFKRQTGMTPTEYIHKNN